MEPEVEDLVDNDDHDGGAEDPDQLVHNNIVTSGDVNGGQKGVTTVKGFKEKKIPNEERTTTPYMTKYERARVLGTRALQIR